MSSLRTLLFVIIIRLWIVISQNDTDITEGHILSLRNELIDFFDDNREFIGRTVRLIFHDCGGSPENLTSSIVSQCNGCLDLQSNDSSHVGLDTIIDELDDIYQFSDNDWSNRMSVADFWSAAATIAIQFAQYLDVKENGGTDELPLIPFYFGREDCSSSPNVNASISNIKPFPGGTAGFDESMDFMRDNFDMNTEEIVAIFGAHTLGSKHVEWTGFDGQWVQHNNFLNNNYYELLRFGTWRQVQVQESGKKQWQDETIWKMLNSDIALMKDIDDFINDTAVGTVTCEWEECPSQNDTKEYVNNFANDNALWLTKFVEAYTKMITVGYDDGELIIIEVETPITTTSTSMPMTTEDDDYEDGGFVEWLRENVLYIAIGGGVLVLLIICLCVCCKIMKKRKEKRQRNIEMFGTATFSAQV